MRGSIGEMPGIEKIHLEDALEDAPQTRSLLTVFQKDAQVLRKYTATMQQLCGRMLGAQREMCAATQALSVHLKSYGRQNFALEGEDSILNSTLQQFSVHMDELSSLHQVLATQMGDSMMYPLNKFLQADIDEVLTMGEMHQICSNDHEQSLARYMKFPRKKEHDQKARQDVNEDLYVYRRKFHQTALHLFSSLNALQYKRKAALLEPLIGYLEAQKNFFAIGKETTSKTEINDFSNNISASILGVHAEMNLETKKGVELMDKMEKTCAHLYHADPPTEMPFIPPNLTLPQKAGYLFLRSKMALISTKWERCYFFVQGGNLMCQTKDEVAGSLILDLNEEGTHAEPTDIDDRRHAFHVVSPKHKKTVVLQAENMRERDEWVATINNVVREETYVRANQGKLPVLQSPAHFYSDPSTTAPAASGESTATDVLRRINPFDESSETVASQSIADNSSFCQTFNVRFLGSMEVRSDRGEQLVHETIRQIMAARAIHDVFKMTESILMVSSEAMRLVDPTTNTIRTEFSLEDISYWAVHKENRRLFGFITRTKSSAQGDNPSFACHVFECNMTGDEICQAIHHATKLAFQVLMEKRELEKQKYIEQQILLANIQNLKEMTLDEKVGNEEKTRTSGQAPSPQSPDDETFVCIPESADDRQGGETKAVKSAVREPLLSSDGQYLILDQDGGIDQASSESTPESSKSPVSLQSSDLNPPITETRGDGDERKIEGAECESEA